MRKSGGIHFDTPWREMWNRKFGSIIGHSHEPSNRVEGHPRLVLRGIDHHSHDGAQSHCQDPVGAPPKSALDEIRNAVSRTSVKSMPLNYHI